MTKPKSIRRNFALVGFMTAGKTHVGKHLSVLTGLPFWDLDAVISEREGRSVATIFRDSGEARFREVEADILLELCQQSGQIISCGGGTILARSNREILVRSCETVWLRVSEEEVISRLRSQNAPFRPLLDGRDPRELIRRLLAQREPFYAQADHFVETDGRAVDEVTREVAVRLGLPTQSANPDDSVGEM